MPFYSCFALPLIVESAMRCADIKTATEALEQIEERALVVRTPFALGAMWRCRALVSDDDRTESSFNSAIDWFEKSPCRTDLARTHLLYGEWLRRKKRRTDARVELRTAHDMFELMERRLSGSEPDWNWTPLESGPGRGMWSSPPISPYESSRSPGSLRTGLPAERSPPNSLSARTPWNTTSATFSRSSESGPASTSPRPFPTTPRRSGRHFTPLLMDRPTRLETRDLRDSRAPGPS